jgi:hypothetical protein
MMKHMEVWETNIAKATNKRILEPMAFHTPQITKTTSTQDLDPLPLTSNDYPSVLPHEMYALEPGDIPSRILSWKALGFLSHVKRRSIDDRFPHAFQIDYFGDHLQTCKTKSVVTQVHDWVVRRLGGILSSVGHRVKIHNITPVTGKERGDVEIRDYVILQKPRDLTDCLPPPRTLILDFTLTHTRFGKSQLSSMGQLTHTRRTDNAPELMELWRRWRGQKFDITDSFILIAQTR